MSQRVSFATWFFMDGFAALISVPIWVYLGYFGAQNWDWMFGVLRQFQHGIFALLGVGLVWLGLMIAPATTLLLFLVGSVLHLGLGDTEDGLLPNRVPRWLGIVGVSRTSA
jgi:hypothetical protein